MDGTNNSNGSTADDTVVADTASDTTDANTTGDAPVTPAGMPATPAPAPVAPVQPTEPAEPAAIVDENAEAVTSDAPVTTGDDQTTA